MARLATAYLAAALVFVAMDAGWLTLMGPKIYRPVIGPLLAKSVDPVAAVAFYALYIAGLVIFAVRPALLAGDWRPAPLYGALLGLVAYGTYDLTNQATLRLWSIGLTIADLGWGMTASAVASLAGFAVARAFNHAGP